MIAPFYSKIRVLKGGAITAMKRHLDETSSTLLRAYLVLARPWIIILSSACDISRVNMLQWDLNRGQISSLEFKTEDNMIFEAEEKRKYLLLLEKAKSNRAGTIIGQVLQQYGLPMNIYEYRQWQRGLVKRLIGWREFLLVQKDTEGIEEEMDEVDKAKLMQACHYVGTAMSLYGMGKGAHTLDRGDKARKASLYQK